MDPEACALAARLPSCPQTPATSRREALVISLWPGTRTVPSPRLATATGEQQQQRQGRGGGDREQQAGQTHRAGRAPRGLPARQEPGQSLASTNAHLSPVNTVGRKSQSELKAPGSGKGRGPTGAEGVRQLLPDGAATRVPPPGEDARLSPPRRPSASAL